jgi:hypothetical protein
MIKITRRIEREGTYDVCESIRNGLEDFVMGKYTMCYMAGRARRGRIGTGCVTARWLCASCDMTRDVLVMSSVPFDVLLCI